MTKFKFSNDTISPDYFTIKNDKIIVKTQDETWHGCFLEVNLLENSQLQYE